MKIVLYTKPIPINRKFFVFRGRNITTKAYKDTKLALGAEMRSQANFEPLEGSLAMTLHLYFGDKRKRDVDAYLKILLDAGEGILYEDDNQISELHVYRHFDKENPRTELDVINTPQN